MTLAKSEYFGDSQCDFWQNENGDIFMTINQLAQALGYASKNGVEVLLNRNEYLKEKEFSGTYRLKASDGKYYNTRVFTEDGIYEVTMLAKTPRAREFRAWVRKVLKSLRKGEVVLMSAEQKKELEIKRKNAEARLINAKVHQAKALLFLIEQYKDVVGLDSQRAAIEYSYKLLTNKKPTLNPLKKYTLTEIAEELGMDREELDEIAERNNLKVKQYGEMVKYRRKFATELLRTFNYNEAGREKLIELAKMEKARNLNRHSENEPKKTNLYLLYSVQPLSKTPLFTELQNGQDEAIPFLAECIEQVNAELGIDIGSYNSIEELCREWLNKEHPDTIIGIMRKAAGSNKLHELYFAYLKDELRMESRNRN